MLLNAFLARYLSLFPLISFTSHHHQAANLSHVSHCIFRTKYGRGLNINSICFVSHPFWPLNEIFQDCSDCRNVICIYVHDQIKYFKIKNEVIITKFLVKILISWCSGQMGSWSPMALMPKMGFSPLKATNRWRLYVESFKKS